MEDQYGSDFMTIVDEDGTEFELEVLSTLEYNGFTYLAVVPAGAEEEDLEVSILKSVRRTVSRFFVPLKTKKSFRLSMI